MTALGLAPAPAGSLRQPHAITPALPARRRRRGRWCLAGSLLAHAPLIALVLWLPTARQIAPTAPPTISVDLVSQPTPRLPRPDTAAPAPPNAAAPPAATAPTARDPGANAERLPTTNRATNRLEFVRPQQMLAARLLEDPQNRQARQALANTVDDERVIQLCALEAMEQIAVWDDAFRPHRVNASAMRDTVLAARTLRADGAAFFSRGRWFHVRFACEVSPDLRNVVSFEFAVGGPIPRRRWAAHHLGTEPAPLD
ncbi:MAG: hypothetical protein AcusKO_10330 [Acuticoccus sp.]